VVQTALGIAGFHVGSAHRCSSPDDYKPAQHRRFAKSAKLQKFIERFTATYDSQNQAAAPTTPLSRCSTLQYGRHQFELASKSCESKTWRLLNHAVWAVRHSLSASRTRRRLTTIATNIANQSTPAIEPKKLTLRRSFRGRETPGRLCIARRNIYFPPARRTIKTDNPLDVAVQGDGWLALQTPAGTATRAMGACACRPAAHCRASTVIRARCRQQPYHPQSDAGPVSIARMDDYTERSSDWRHWSFTLDKTRSSSASTIPALWPASLRHRSRFLHKRHRARLCRRSQRQPLMEMEKLILLSRTFENVTSAIEGSESR